MRLSKQTYYDNASSLSQGDNNIRSAPKCSTVGRKVQAVKDWMTDVSVTRVRATTTVCTKCQGWRGRRGNICLELLSPGVTLLCAQLQTFIFCLWECSILTICFHSSFCILSASSLTHSLTHSFSVSRAHTQIRSPPSHSMDQRLVGVLDESYQQFTQFKASFKLLPFQSGTVLITDNSFRSRKEFWRTFVVRPSVLSRARFTVAELRMCRSARCPANAKSGGKRCCVNTSDDWRRFLDAFLLITLTRPDLLKH